MSPISEKPEDRLLKAADGGICEFAPCSPPKEANRKIVRFLCQTAAQLHTQGFSRSEVLAALFVAPEVLESILDVKFEVPCELAGKEKTT